MSVHKFLSNNVINFLRKLVCVFACKRGHRMDLGSGTALGVMSVIAVCSMLVLSAILGNVLSVKHQANAVASAAALSGAAALQRMEPNACYYAARTVTSSGVMLKDCTSTADDVTVRVAAKLNIPFAPSVEVVARAGLEDCSD